VGRYRKSELEHAIASTSNPKHAALLIHILLIGLFYPGKIDVLVKYYLILSYFQLKRQPLCNRRPVAKKLSLFHFVASGE